MSKKPLFYRVVQSDRFVPLMIAAASLLVVVAVLYRPAVNFMEMPAYKDSCWKCGASNSNSDGEVWDSLKNGKAKCMKCGAINW